MAVRRIVTDLDLGEVPDALEVVPPPVDLGPWRANEVLVVSADPDVLGVAGDLGVHRLVPGEGVADAVAELVAFLDH